MNIGLNHIAMLRGMWVSQLRSRKEVNGILLGAYARSLRGRSLRKKSGLGFRLA